MIKALYITVLLFGLLTTTYAQDKIALLSRSELVLASGDTTRALAAFSEVLRLYPQSFAAAMRLAEINLQQGNYDKAVQFCNVALDITDNFIENSTISLNKLGIPPDSSGLILQYKKDQGHMHHIKGVGRRYQNRALDAEHELKRALGLDPSLTQTKLELASLFSEQGRFKEAKLLLKEAVNHDPKDIRAQLNLASLYYNLEELDSAVLIYTRISLQASELKWPYLYLGHIYSAKEEAAKAIEQYSLYLSIDSLSEEVHYRRAVQYINLQDYKNALIDWKQVVALNPLNIDAWRNKGLTNFQLDLHEAAITDFSKALELDPNQEYTQVNRGYCYYLINKPKKALKDIEAGLVIVPKYYLGHYFKALVYTRLAKKKKACSELDKAIELGMKDKEIDQKLISRCF